MRVVRFTCPSSCSSSSLPACDRTEHRWTSAASSRAQWALQDLNRQLPIEVGTAGLQPAKLLSQWAPPGLSRRSPDTSGHRGPQTPAPGRSGHCRASTGEAPIPVGTAGPHRAKPRSQWAPPGSTARKKVRIMMSPARGPKQCGGWNWEEDTVS